MFGRNTVTGKSFFNKAGELAGGDPMLFVTSIFYTFQGEGPFTGQPAVFVRLAKCNLACSFCFVAGTMITMGDGSRKPIEEIREGESVLSWDGEKFVKGDVTLTMESETNELVSIRANGVLTTCTPEHPILVKDKGWVQAKDVCINDTIIHLSTSERMRLFNPMKDPNVAAKVAAAHHANPERRNILQELWDNPDSGLREKVLDRALTDNPMKDPAVAIKGFLARTDLDRRSSTESKVEAALSGMGVKFVGNGDLVVANKCPDFVVDGQLKLIEVWDDERTEYWCRDSSWRDAREKAFAAEGYSVLFLPVTRHTPDDVIRKKVGEFINNGLVVTEVNAFTNPGNGVGQAGKRWVRYAGKKGAAVKTYNFEVADTHTYVANNMVVHNCDAYFEEGDWMSFEQVKAAAMEAVAGTVSGVDAKAFARRRVGLVVTGGEPMLQDHLTGFLAETRHDFAWQQIESNGTQNISALPANVKTVISPKCAEKGGVPTKYLMPHQSVLSSADCLKFVVSSDSDSPYHDIPDWAKELAAKGRPVYISPMNVYKKLPAKAVAIEFNGKASMSQRSTVDEVVSFWDDDLLDRVANRANHEYAARLCVENAYIFNLQGHLYGSMA